MAAGSVPPAAQQCFAAKVCPGRSSSLWTTTIRAVQREVLPEVVRVTVELDREVPFYQERLEGPSRLFFDLKGTKTVPALVDATFRYDTDVVRHIRLGRHPNNTTRIVLDLEHVGKYSVFTLYNPYRIVIDSERAPSTPVVADIETAGTRPVTAAYAAPVASTVSVAPRAPVAPPGRAYRGDRTFRTYRTTRTRRTYPTRPTG